MKSGQERNHIAIRDKMTSTVPPPKSEEELEQKFEIKKGQKKYWYKRGKTGMSANGTP